MDKIPFEIANFFLAMQAGRNGADALQKCFAKDAIYEEPFSGQVHRHQGRQAVMQAMARGWENPMPDMRIEIARVDIKDEIITLKWICHSPGIPGGKGHGTNRYVMRDGLIAELVTTLDVPQR